MSRPSVPSERQLAAAVWKAENSPRMLARLTHATYTLLDGAPLAIDHHGTTITISIDEHVTEAIPPAVSRPSPSQPRGRAPARRGKAGD